MFWSFAKKSSRPLPLISGFRKQARGGGIGGRLLTAGEGEHVAQSGALARHHDAHAGIARARGDCRCAEHERKDADSGCCFSPSPLRIASPAMT